MDTPKPAPELRVLVIHEHRTASTPERRVQKKRSVPGPLFDAFVIGTFLVLVIGYYL
jgi:hypothetical protein